MLTTCFLKIDYLTNGTIRQKQAYQTLSTYKIFERLSYYSPILAGTIPLNIDIESSDLDIICCYDDAEQFVQTLPQHFSEYPSFKTEQTIINGQNTVIANFVLEDFEIEVFGQQLPTQQQSAYRHLLIEHYLLQLHGESLRKHVIRLKNQGYKTEPAFAIALNLEGNPYLAFQLADKLL